LFKVRDLFKNSGSFVSWPFSFPVTFVSVSTLVLVFDSVVIVGERGDRGGDTTRGESEGGSKVDCEYEGDLEAGRPVGEETVGEWELALLLNANDSGGEYGNTGLHLCACVAVGFVRPSEPEPFVGDEGEPLCDDSAEWGNKVVTGELELEITFWWLLIALFEILDTAEEGVGGVIVAVDAECECDDSDADTEAGVGVICLAADKDNSAAVLGKFTRVIEESVGRVEGKISWGTGP
jgi:hypothetical protein